MQRLALFTVRFSGRTKGSWRACLLVGLLSAAFPAQGVLPFAAASQSQLAESQRQGEEESDQSESSSEEDLGTLCGLVFGRDRRLYAASGETRQELADRCPKLPALGSQALVSRPRELISRNGAGGPLRC